jgi:hypothetical protein
MTGYVPSIIENSTPAVSTSRLSPFPSPGLGFMGLPGMNPLEMSSKFSSAATTPTHLPSNLPLEPISYNYPTTSSHFFEDVVEGGINRVKDNVRNVEQCRLNILFYPLININRIIKEFNLKEDYKN